MVPVLASIWRLVVTMTPRCGIDTAVGEHELDARITALGRAARVEAGELLAGPRQVAHLDVPEALRVPHVVDLADREVHADRVESARRS